MKIHEAEARELLARAGLPVPDADVATTAAGARAIAADMAGVYARFPRLKERARQLAGTLSGG